MKRNVNIMKRIVNIIMKIVKVKMIVIMLYVLDAVGKGIMRIRVMLQNILEDIIYTLEDLLINKKLKIFYLLVIK